MADNKPEEYELVPRSPQELEALFTKLVAFLMSNPELNWVETQDGVLVGISPLKPVKKSVIATPKKKDLIIP
jgi:hypothetical protein